MWEMNMKTINIKGKEYTPVVERVKEAHLQDPDFSLDTEKIFEDENWVEVKAMITFKGKKFAGHSMASKTKGMMKDVALEIAETSAVGRALGFANIGIIDGIASADEMRKVKKSVSEEDEDVPF